MKNCNCSAVDMCHYVYRNLQATKISKLQLIVPYTSSTFGW